MRSIKILCILLFPYLSISQTAYYEALDLTNKKTAIEQFIKEVDQHKAMEAQKGRVSTFGSQEEEAALLHVYQFLKDPFFSDKDPILALNQVKVWIQAEDIVNKWTSTMPSFHIRPEGIIINYRLDTLYQITEDKGIFSYLYDIPNVPMYFVTDSIYAARLPKSTEQLMAIYNKTTGLFYNYKDGNFSPSPIAYFDQSDQTIYEGIPKLINRKIPFPNFNYKDNSIYANYTNLILVYQDTLTDQIHIGELPLAKDMEFDDHLLDPVSIHVSDGTSVGLDGSVYRISATAIARSGPSFPSTAIDAIAQFLVDRTKEELVLTFFERFLEKLENSSELSSLFPNTCYVLKTHDLFRLPSMGKLWVESFQADLQDMLTNVELLLLTDPDYAELADNPKIRAFRVTYDLLQLYEQELPPLEIIDNIYAKFTTVDDPISSNLKTLRTFSQELKSEDPAVALISAQELLRLSNLETKYFAAFFYFANKTFLEQQNQNLSFPIKEFMENSGGAIIRTLANLSNLLLELENKNKLYRSKLLSDSYDKKTDNTYFQISQTIFQLLEFGFKMQFLTQVDAYYRSEVYQEYFSVIRNTIQAAEDIQQEEFGVFVIHLSQLLDPIIQEKVKFKGIQDTQKATKIIKDIFFYSSFIVDVLSARDAFQINGILQQYALPVGSYRLKRQSTFSMELNAYPGSYFGGEAGLDNNLERGKVVGITAPIGLSFNWDIGEETEKDKHAFGLFVPVIDVGAAFSYRWSGEAVGFPQQLKWRQVLSPGIHAVWGIKKVPIALMAGMQFTPQLRAIENAKAISTNKSVFRYGLSAVVDIPIFSLFVKE